jgi:hypothetical protein
MSGVLPGERDIQPFGMAEAAGAPSKEAFDSGTWLCWATYGRSRQSTSNIEGICFFNFQLLQMYAIFYG